MKKVLTILAILVFFFSINAYAIPQIEREALIALYESTDGDNWDRNGGWKTPPLDTDGFAMPETECDWEGVNCWYRGLGLLNEVSGLDLYGNQLTGTIPPELGNLKNLNVFDLNNNQLSGTIPSELGNLSSIVYFDLSNNQLSGTIPPELANLSFNADLYDNAIFSLSNNQLSGAIPPELGNLSFTGYAAIFSLSNNQLSGPIPPELGNLSFGNLPVSAWVEYAIFDLSNNQLSGTIPPELGNISFNAQRFERFNLSNNQLSGPIPPELGNLGWLAFFDLNNNQLSGTIPSELGNLSSVVYFDLSNNQLSGTIPPELGNISFDAWPAPPSLDLSNNQLSGPIPPELGNNSNLSDINLSSNQLTGPIPLELFTGFDSLWWRSFDLSHNLLIGPVQLDFDYEWSVWEINICNNYLYTDDNKTRDFLNDRQPGWEDCQYALPAFSFTPATLSVPASAGSASVNVSNTGGGTLQWTATVTSGNDWLSITSGSSGIDTGTVTCAYNQNSGGQRIGTIRFESLTEQSHDYQVTQEAATHTLTTSASPSAGGSVTRSPNESTFTHGVSVELTATPSPGYTFSNWSGDASGSSNPVTVTMNANKSVTANFVTVTTHTLTINLSGSGSVVRNPDKTSYSHNESVQLTATSSSGHTFSHWSGGATGSSNPVTVTMDSNKSVTANFTALSHTLSTAFNPASSGSVTINPNKPSYSYNETVQLTAIASSWFKFSHWSGGASGSSNPVTVTMNANKSVTANFAADIAAPTVTPDGGTHTGETVSVTVSCATPGVTIRYTTNGNDPTESSPTVASGGTVSVPIPGTLKARAWLGSDTSVTKTSAYTGPDNHAISLSILGRGVGNLTSQPAGISCIGTEGDSCIAYFDADSGVTLTANPDPGSVFKAWGGDCAGQPGNTCTLIMDANRVVEAHFLLKDQPNAIGDYLSVVTLTPAERDFVLDIGDGTKPFPETSQIEEVRFQNDTATIHYRDGTSQVVNVKYGDGYADDFINQVLLSETVGHTFTTLLNLPSFDVELEFPGDFVVVCYPGISPVSSGPGIQISDLALLKLKPVGQSSLPFAYRVNAPVDGDFWITNHLQEAVLPATHTLNPGQVVDLYLAVEDNGLYDLDDTSNVIVDPLVLGQVEKSSVPKPQYEGTYSGIFLGTNFGTWTAKIDAEGFGQGFVFSQLYNVPDFGIAIVTSEGNLIGTLHGGAVISGTIDSSGNVVGVWNDESTGDSGTLTGRRNLPVDIKALAGVYRGTYSGTDSGTWTATLSSEGSVTGTSWSNIHIIEDSGTGIVNSSGEFVASLDGGSIMYGTINPAGNVTGFWVNQNTGDSGTLSGSQEKASIPSTSNGGGGGGGCFIDTVLR